MSHLRCSKTPATTCATYRAQHLEQRCLGTALPKTFFSATDARECNTDGASSMLRAVGPKEYSPGQEERLPRVIDPTIIYILPPETGGRWPQAGRGAGGRPIIVAGHQDLLKTKYVAPLGLSFFERNVYLQICRA